MYNIENYTLQHIPHILKNVIKLLLVNQSSVLVLSGIYTHLLSFIYIIKIINIEIIINIIPLYLLVESLDTVLLLGFSSYAMRRTCAFRPFLVEGVSAIHSTAHWAAPSTRAAATQ